MNESNSNQLPSRAFVRKIIDSVFISGSDLDAFLIDYFSNIYRRVQGLERVAKVNLLLEQIEPTDVIKNIKLHLGTDYEKILIKNGFFPMSESADGTHLRQTDGCPVVVFIYEQNRGWLIKNIGQTPAMDIIVAVAGKTGQWMDPVRTPPLGVNDTFDLTWLGHLNMDKLGAGYSDAQNRQYSTVCADDHNKFSKDNILPAWAEEQIQRHWGNSVASKSSKLVIGSESSPVFYKLDESLEDRILNSIANSIRVSLESLSAALGMRPTLVQTWLNRLEHLGLIQRMEITDRGVRYTITPQGIAHVRRRT